MYQKSKFTNVHKILIIRLRYIGDVLLSIPAIRAVKEAFPNSRITFLANPGTATVLENNPLLHEIIYYEKDHSLHFLSKLRTQEFDMAIDPTFYDRSAIAAFVSGARYRIAPDPRGQGFFGKKYLYTHLAKYPDPLKHKLLQYLAVVQEFGMTTSDLSTPIFLHPQERAFVDEVFHREHISDSNFVIHAHPFARFSEKQWDFARMAATLDYLNQKPGCRLIVTCSNSPDDLAQLKEIHKHLKTRPVFLVGTATIRQVAALASRAGLFFGLDSGIMHIAAGMGTPVVAIFGSSAVIHWRPWGDHHTVITDQRLDQPYQHQEPNGSGKSPFLEKLDIPTVLSALESQLSRLQCVPNL